jgi:hypothetical protein
MMRLLLVAVIAMVVGVNSQPYEVKATFTKAVSGIDGWVKIDNAGNVSLWYNISGANQTALANCLSGHSYHIHDLWLNYGTATEASLFNCGGTNTGLHYDPTSACGAKSSSVFCQPKGRCVPSSSAGSATAGDYSANCNGVYNDYLANPYGCEVGDLKGKFGAVNPLTYYNWQDPYMPLVSALVNKSIVFHCPSTGARAFCAQFKATSTPAPTTPRKRVDMTASKKTAESPYGTIEFLGDGSHTISLDVTSIQADLTAISSTCISGGLKYHIHQKWTHTDASYKVGSTDCGAGPTGGHYDPTLACSGVTDNALCFSKGGCVNGSSLGMDGTTYSCVGGDTDPYKCEVSDLSNMFGNIAFPAGTTVSTPVNTATSSMFGKYQPIMPSLAMLEGKSIVFHCATGGARALCMKIGAPGTGSTGSGTTSTTGDATSTTGAVAAASTVAPALLLSFVAFLFAL